MSIGNHYHHFHNPDYSNYHPLNKQIKTLRIKNYIALVVLAQTDEVLSEMTLCSPVLTKSLIFRATHVTIDNASSRECSIFSTDNQGTKLVSNTNDTINHG